MRPCPETPPELPAPWEDPPTGAIRIEVPLDSRPNDLGTARELIQAGTSPDIGPEGDPFFVLGIDFGTSSTKVVARLPYEAGEPAWAIPAPRPCRYDGAPYLWHTLIWLCRDGRFSPWREPGAVLVSTLKSDLVRGEGERYISVDDGVPPASFAEAAAAYLGYVARYTRGWLRRSCPHLFSGARPAWLVHVGLPAATYDDPALSRPYRRIALAARRILDIDDEISVPTVRRLLNDPETAAADGSNEASETYGAAVIPEAAASMSGFARSPRVARALYLLIDVGALTLDACTFRLNKNREEGERYAFMAADVRKLGVEVYHWALRNGRRPEEFAEQCHRMLRSVIWHTRQRRDPNAEAWRAGNHLPVLLTGGGALHGPHRNIVHQLDGWLRRYTDSGGIRTLQIPQPDGLELPERWPDSGRLTVAWGLSLPTDQIGEIEPVGAIEDVPRWAPAGDFTSRYVGKEQV